MYRSKYYELKESAIKNIVDSVATIRRIHQNYSGVFDGHMILCNKIGLSIYIVLDDDSVFNLNFVAMGLDEEHVYNSYGDSVKYSELNYFCICEISDEISAFASKLRKNKIQKILDSK
jgi:hypothetical protein